MIFEDEKCFSVDLVSAVLLLCDTFRKARSSHSQGPPLATRNAELQNRGFSCEYAALEAPSIHDINPAVPYKDPELRELL